VAWAFSVSPRAGWGGDAQAKQRATAGWLAALPVFEPHWQARTGAAFALRFVNNSVSLSLVAYSFLIVWLIHRC
jgi:hypothetical protein